MKNKWVVYQKPAHLGSAIFHIIEENTDKEICMLGGSIKREDEIFSNANLIAAAPDLIEACKKVMTGGYGCAPSVGYMDELKKICEKAINKAIGK